MVGKGICPLLEIEGLYLQIRSPSFETHNLLAADNFAFRLAEISNSSSPELLFVDVRTEPNLMGSGAD